MVVLEDEAVTTVAAVSCGRVTRTVVCRTERLESSGKMVQQERPPGAGLRC